ncbi:MAG: SUMF1/EgtB/PvdO family nonheme iron enzyme [Bacteroidetes bacterium]|nr:SUMF1/EgtB/PvdO family nonheme iron enzyme [Bacteroidota bacterium]
MSKKKAEKSVKVKLKSILGIPPGLYLLILYAFIALSILFLVCFLPGILNNGSKVSFSTNPDGAAVYCDDIYIGSGEFSEFIPKGIHTFSLKKHGYVSEFVEREIRGRIVFSWIFPRRESVRINMKLDSLDKYLSSKAKTLYEWSYSTDYSSNYFFPEIYTDMAEDLAATNLTASQITRVSEFYKHTAALISSDTMLIDYTIGAEILNKVYKIQFTENSNVELLQSYFSGNDTFTYEPSLTEINSLNGDQKNNLENIQLNNTEYFPISADNALLGNPAFTSTSKLTEFPSQVSLDSYAVAARELSVNDYALFVEQNPTWAVTNKQKLLDDGFVDEQYLLDMDLLNPDDLPIRNISWYAAKAYCNWVSDSMPIEYSNLYMSLPSTSQWQYAATLFNNTYISTLSSAPVFTKVPVNFMGNVWEFCNDTFLPTGVSLYINIDDELENNWIQKTVMGGSWANSPSDIALYTIGSIEPYSCSEFIGFRPVLLFKE